MKYVKFLSPGGECYGRVRQNLVHAVDGDIFEEDCETGRTFELDKVKILPPVNPSKIVAVGLNYHAHVKEFGNDVPTEPLIFIKPSTCVIAHEQYIELPPQSQKVDFEGELAIVIKKTAKNVEKEDALDYVFGYTCLNDVTARDLQRKDGQWTRGKGFDTFAPLGPFIETELDPDNLSISTTLNGEVRQQSNTNMFIFDTRTLISHISKIMTLLPGDVITTGTPSGVGQLSPGDVVAVKIQNIGTLTSFVK